MLSRRKLLVLAFLFLCTAAISVGASDESNQDHDDIETAPPDMAPTPVIANPDGRVLGKVTKWIEGRIKKLTDKFRAIVAKLNPPKMDGSDHGATSDKVQEFLTKVKDLPDTELTPANEDVAAAAADNAAADSADIAIVEALDASLVPDNPLSFDPDSQADEAAQEAGSGSEITPGQDPVSVALGTKLISRADAGVSVTEDALMDMLPENPPDSSSFLEVRDKKSSKRIFASHSRRKRRRSLAEFGNFLKDFLKAAAQPALVKVAGGSHVLAFGGEVEVMWDFSIEEMALGTCVSLVLGSESFGASVEYKFSIGWHGKEQKEKLKQKNLTIEPDKTEYLAAIALSGGVGAYGVHANVGASLGINVGNLIQTAWETIHGMAKNEPAQGKDTPAAAKSRFANASKAVKDAAENLKNAVIGIGKGIVDAPKTLSASLAAGADVFDIFNPKVGFAVTASACTVQKSFGKVKLWKMLLSLFALSGPPGVLVGFWAWAVHHGPTVKEWYKKMKDSLKAFAVKSKKASVQALVKMYDEYETAKQDLGSAVDKMTTFFDHGAKAFQARLLSADAKAAQMATKVKTSVFSKIKDVVKKIKDLLKSKPRTKKATIYSFIPAEEMVQTQYYKSSFVNRIKKVFTK